MLVLVDWVGLNAVIEVSGLQVRLLSAVLAVSGLNAVLVRLVMLVLGGLRIFIAELRLPVELLLGSLLLGSLLLALSPKSAGVVKTELTR